MKVVFVCSGNTCRSPLAQALFEKCLHDKNVFDVEVDSVGLGCGYGNQMADNTKKIIEEKGILFSHTSQEISLNIIESSDYIITMERWQKECLKDVVSQEKLYCIDDFTNKGDIADPFGKDYNSYMQVAEKLEQANEYIIKSLELVKKM